MTTVSPTVGFTRVDTDPGGRRAVADLFTEPDFHFRRTPIPDLLCAGEIDELVPGDALLCHWSGHPAGLVWFEEVAAGYPAHFQLHARFSRTVPATVAAAATEWACRALAADRPLRRISYDVRADDSGGVELAERLGLDLEGAVPDLEGPGNARNYYATLFKETDDA